MSPIHECRVLAYEGCVCEKNLICHFSESPKSRQAVFGKLPPKRRSLAPSHVADFYKREKLGSIRRSFVQGHRIAALFGTCQSMQATVLDSLSGTHDKMGPILTRTCAQSWTAGET